MTEQYTTISEMADPVKNYLKCNLLHTKQPMLTGKKKWNKYIKKYTWEVIMVCHECKENLYKPLNEAQ